MFGLCHHIFPPTPIIPFPYCICLGFDLVLSVIELDVLTFLFFISELFLFAGVAMGVMIAGFTMGVVVAALSDFTVLITILL